MKMQKKGVNQNLFFIYCWWRGIGVLRDQLYKAFVYGVSVAYSLHIKPGPHFVFIRQIMGA